MLCRNRFLTEPFVGQGGKQNLITYLLHQTLAIGVQAGFTIEKPSEGLLQLSRK